MGMRVALAKAATATSGPASDGKLASVKVRIQDPPWLIQTNGGYTGTVAIEHSVDDASVVDASATWYQLGTVANNATMSITHPLYRIRANAAAVTAGTANVYLVEYVRRLRRAA